MIDLSKLDKADRAELCCLNLPEMETILDELEQIKILRDMINHRKNNLVLSIVVKYGHLIPELVCYRGRNHRILSFKIDDAGCLRVDLKPVKKDGTPLLKYTLECGIQALTVSELRPLVAAIAGIEMRNTNGEVL